MKNKLNLLIVALFLLIQTTLAQTWTQIGQDIDGEAEGDLSGSSVSLSSDGNTVAIGAPWNIGNADDAGHVRVYQNVNGSWTQIGSDIDGEAEGDWSGHSVSLSSDGKTVAIGAPGTSNTDDTGHVRVYQNVNGSWTQIGSDIDGEASRDFFGYSVSLSSDGSIVAIGEHGQSISAGHVSVYQNVNGSWTQIGSDIDGVVGSEVPPGGSVSLSSDGKTVAIGEPYNVVNGYDSGHVRVYQNVNGSWTQIGSDIDGEVDNWRGRFNSVSLSSDGNIVAIGTPGNDGNGTDAGHVKVYKNINGSWTQIGSDIDGEAYDESGWSVSLSSDGKTVAIGARNNGGNDYASGHVKVYKNINGSWTQIGSGIDGEAEYDHSGASVSLSSDGNIVAIGAPGNGGNGNLAGHVSVYKNINGSWIQIGSDIDGEAWGDRSGASVSLSSDGNIVAIGAPENNGNGDWTGHVRIYKLETGANTETIEAHNIYISPNPVSDILTVNGISQPVEFQITDLTGKEILSGEISNNSVDVSTLKVGIYLLKLENRSIQFVKE